MTTLERTVQESFLSADDIRWIHGYLRGMLDSGQDREQLELILEHVHRHFQQEGQDRLADLALEGLDLLTAWCGPGMEIPFPETAV